MAERINISQFGQIISHFDGNNNDKDDIAALPIAATIVNAAGLQNKSTFFYNNNLGEPNESSQVQAMRRSAAFAEKLGIDTFNYQANTQKTTEELVKILNSGQKVLAIEGGPMEAIYRGLEKTSPQNRRNITLLSHSSWNENRNIATRSGVKDVRTWAELKRDFPKVNFVDIDNQNGLGDSGFNNRRWNWLDSTNNSLLKEARGLMKNAQNKVNDPSDAGMHLFAITGNENADPNDAQSFFAANPPKFIVEAESMELSGEYRVETIDIASGKKVISLIRGSDEGTGRAKFNFNGLSGKYDIKISFFDENDGFAKFNLNQGNQQIASVDLNKQLGSPVANGKTLTSIDLKDVSIKAGDSFTLRGFEEGIPPVAEHVRIDKIEFTPTSEAIRINAGGKAFTDSSGNQWSEDKFAQGGKVFSTTAGIGQTQDDSLFQTERFDKELSYAIPVANGNYTVNLNFAEIYWNQVNRRVFDVEIENKLVIENLDIYAEAGGKNIALEKSFQVDVQDGTLNLDFSSTINNVKVSGIEIVPN